MYHTKRERKT